MLADNILYLKNHYSNLYKQLKKLDDDKYPRIVEIQKTKNGSNTLKVEDNGKSFYLHSKYNPEREATTIINEELGGVELTEQTQVVFYGVGLGYHINEFIKKYPDIPFSIYEPSVEVLYNFLNINKINDLDSNLDIISCDDDMMKFFLSSIIRNNKQTTIMVLPVYKNVFKDKLECFLSEFKQRVTNKRVNLHTNNAFEKRWILNSMINFKEVINTPNILMLKDNPFKGKTAILVAAGPSLDEEIVNLRFIKENKLAYIFAVGSANNTLIHYDIMPDAVCSIDPGQHNKEVFSTLNQQEHHIPLIYGSSIGFESLLDYKGPKYHMITSQDTIAQYILNADLLDIHIAQDAPSIAVISLSLLNKLGFSKILLVGQNFALKNDKEYASGINYESPNFKENIKDYKNYELVEEVSGGLVYTKKVFNVMRIEMEQAIKQFNNTTVINTTKSGAKILGTRFMHLEDVVKDLLGSIEPFDKLFLKSKSYDSQKMQKRIDRLKTEYQRLIKDLDELQGSMHHIRHIKNKSMVKLEEGFERLTNSAKKITKNDFSRVVIIPMNRNMIDIIAQEIHDNSQIKSNYKKVNMYIKVFNKLLDIFNNQIQEIHDTHALSFLEVEDS